MHQPSGGRSDSAAGGDAGSGAGRGGNGSHNGNNNNPSNGGGGNGGRTKANPARYKTELCRAFQEKGSCKYGSKCQFAHGPEELRRLARHPKYKTEMCRTYHSTGLCPYGPRCHFIHNPDQLSDELKMQAGLVPVAGPMARVPQSRSGSSPTSAVMGVASKAGRSGGQPKGKHSPPLYAQAQAMARAQHEAVGNANGGQQPLVDYGQMPLHPMSPHHGLVPQQPMQKRGYVSPAGMHHGGGDLEYQLPMSAGPSLPAYSGGNMDMSMYAMSSSPHASFSYAYEAHSQHSHFPLPPGPPPTMRHAHSVPPIQHAGQHPQDYPYGRQPLSSASATPTSAPHSSPFLHFEQHSHAPAAFDMHSHSHFDPTPKSAPPMVVSTSPWDQPSSIASVASSSPVAGSGGYAGLYAAHHQHGNKDGNVDGQPLAGGGSGSSGSLIDMAGFKLAAEAVSLLTEQSEPSANTGGAALPGFDDAPPLLAATESEPARPRLPIFSTISEH